MHSFCLTASPLLGFKRQLVFGCSNIVAGFQGDLGTLKLDTVYYLDYLSSSAWLFLHLMCGL